MPVCQLNYGLCTQRRKKTVLLSETGVGMKALADLGKYPGICSAVLISPGLLAATTAFTLSNWTKSTMQVTVCCILHSTCLSFLCVMKKAFSGWSIPYLCLMRDPLEQLKRMGARFGPRLCQRRATSQQYLL